MTTRLQALLSLRWNYSLKGGWVWLKGRGRCRACPGLGEIERPTSFGNYFSRCETCGGTGRSKRGYQRILSEPDRVLAEQEAMAEGVFV
jgi:hypothetical protein